MRRDHLVLSALLIATLTTSAATTAQEWSRFRGPNGAGVSTSGTFPAKWTEDDYQWSIDLPGTGHSSPVIWGQRLFVTACNEEASQRLLICVDTRSGDILWQKPTEFESYKKHKNNSFASSTPCVDDKHVYAVWHSKKSSPLMAWDHDGNEIWRHELGAYTHGQGGATSPIVHNGMVVLAHDQKKPSFLLAVDAANGNKIWKVPRLGERACYATPCVFATTGRSPELVFSHCYEGIVGVDPGTGKLNWHIDVFGRASQRALSSVVCTDRLVMASSGGVGGERQLVAIRPTGNNETVKATEAWRTKKQAPHVPTPLVYRDWVFMWSDQGIASCLNKATGDVIWKKRVGGNYFGSPICVGGKLYCIDLDGTVVVTTASDSYELLGRTSLGQGAKSTPAVSGDLMFFRTETHLFALKAE